jgi:hypothetical protein
VYLTTDKGIALAEEFQAPVSRETNR